MENISSAPHVPGMGKMKPEMLLAPEMDPERVGRRVTAMREAMAIQKSAFADSIGLDRSALSRIEQGKEGLGIAKATRIADLYGFGLNYLYRGDLSDVPPEIRSRLLNELHLVGALPR